MGIALTAAALSVTVGVLVGAVITIGNHARSQSVASTPAASAPSSPSLVGDSAGAVAPASVQASISAPAPASASIPMTSGPAPSAPPPSVGVAGTSAVLGPVRPTTTPVKATPRRSVPPATVITIYLTTTTPTPAHAPAPAPPPPPAATPTTTPTTTTTTTPRSTPAPPAGAPTAGQPCQTLGAKDTAPGGSNVFCQRNFATGSLAWRAVVDGGGCLNKTMTGIGIDGRNYTCRPDGPHLDRWRPAH